MKKRLVLISLIIITLLGGFLRFYKITQNPPSLTGDEISFGYAAYSILKTGRDESGRFLPLVIQSIGDYKNPLPAYLMVLSIKILGLSDFAVRFQNALFGTLTIPVFFFFLKDILKDRRAALLGTFFLSISAWHIFYSRFAYEPLIASFFALLGIWFLMKMLGEKAKRYPVLSALFLILTMYTGFAPRLFIPLFVFAVLIFKIRRLKVEKSKFIIFFLTLSLLGLPLVWVSLFQGASTRFKMVFIGNDIDFVRYVSLRYFESLQDLPLLIFFWLKRYLNYLQPDFLFFNALQMTLPGTFGLGLFYLFDLPFLVFGVGEFIRRKIPHREILAIWLLIGIIPDSLTNNEQHAGRLLHVVPVAILLTTLGAVYLWRWFLNLKKTWLKLGVVAIYTSVVVLVLIHAFLVFTVHFPRQKGESFDEGWREVVQYLIPIQNKYQEIVFDTRRGVDAPNMISNPQMYLLFYSKYDPQTYQTEPKIYGTAEKPFFKFDKYTFRYIDWDKDSGKKDTLFVGSPWSFPREGLKEGELLTKIYLTNGAPAFYVVSPR